MVRCCQLLQHDRAESIPGSSGHAWYAGRQRRRPPTVPPPPTQPWGRRLSQPRAVPVGGGRARAPRHPPAAVADASHVGPASEGGECEAPCPGRRLPSLCGWGAEGARERLPLPFLEVLVGRSSRVVRSERDSCSIGGPGERTHSETRDPRDRAAAADGVCGLGYTSIAMMTAGSSGST
jgi:hypothetical protein